MKKNILLLLPLISTASALSMDTRNHHLAQTVMISTPIVKKEGLGVWRYVSDATQTWEANNLYYDLENKIYDPLNQQYIDKLNRTIDTFASTNDSRLPKALDFCRDNYKGQIKIKEEVALAAHICLTEEIQTKLSNLKKILQANDKTFLEEQNKLIATLKESFAKQIAIITTNLESHKKTRDALLKQEGDMIRINKKAALVSHKLSPFKVPKDEYCSDDEEQNPDEIEQFYTDRNLLSKMAIGESTFATVNKTDRALTTLNEMNSELQFIQPFRY